MSTISHMVTVEELSQFPNDGMRRELRRGDLITMPPLGFEHGRISARIVAKLFIHAEGQNLGLVISNDSGFLLEENPDTVLAPDVAFISHTKLSRMVKRRGYHLGPPDLAVEVVSPSDRLNEVHDKAREFVGFGAADAWVVNPRDRSITIYAQDAEPVRLESGDTLRDRNVLPGFECGVSDLIGTMLFDE
jgi:Uma2 family endonuclease